MIWNYLLQGFFAYIARNVLIFSVNGLLLCLLVTSVIQGIDTIWFYFYSKKRFLRGTPEAIHDGRLEAFKDGAVYKIPQLFIFKVIWYSCFSMGVAAVLR